MASVAEPSVKTRRLRRVEHDRLMELGMLGLSIDRESPPARGGETADRARHADPRCRPAPL